MMPSHVSLLLIQWPVQVHLQCLQLEEFSHNNSQAQVFYHLFEFLVLCPQCIFYPVPSKAGLECSVI
ncbi:hypothetical protein X975_09079, partial [Stegodyphus mimosarum]